MNKRKNGLIILSKEEGEEGRELSNNFDLESVERKIDHEQGRRTHQKGEKIRP